MRGSIHLGGVIVAAFLCGPADAIDLTVSNVEVNQGVQFGSTVLVAGNVTYVRATIGVSGIAADVDNVDAVLRVFVDGVELPESPIRSLNGYIRAPLSPRREDLDDTVNFLLLVPQSNNVDFQVEVNPDRLVGETNYDNNIGVLNDRVFACRKLTEIVYVPIDYRPGGGGSNPPPPDLIKPGIGDGFHRAIYKAGEWNYHKTPLPDLIWTQDVNNSDTALLNTLRDIRINQLPRNGFPQPDFVYGWLPGNPYGGNGRAIGIPGDVAFGNSQTSRHQRTMAHECGHLLGQAHNSRTIGTVGIDVEHHLWDTEDLPVLHPSSQWDIMVAGQLTNAAYIDRTTFDSVMNDSRLRCANPAPQHTGSVLRLSGVYVHATGELHLDPITRVERGALTATNPAGGLSVVAYAAGGRRLYNVEVETPAPWESCEAADPTTGPATAATSSFYVLIPESPDGETIHRIDVVDVNTGAVVAGRSRSTHAPTARFTRTWIDGRLSGPSRAEWVAEDADNDPLTANLLYSPDAGESWLPLGVNLTGDAFEFDASSVPHSRGPHGRIRLVVSDGFNVTTVDDDEQGVMGDPTPPDVYLITPNHGFAHLEGAPIAFHAAAWDREDLMLSGRDVVWTSSVDGELGTGLLLTRDDLSLGEHVITVTATDSDGGSDSDQITLTITERRLTGVTCGVIKKFTAACRDSGAIKGKVVLRNEDFDGYPVVFGVGSNAIPVPISGKRAKLNVCCFSGNQQVRLDSPAGCFDPIPIVCP